MLIGRKFHVSYSVSGGDEADAPARFQPQVPARRVAERSATYAGDAGRGAGTNAPSRPEPVGSC
uniref:Uncharacterized protein n=1 Tax=Streptomyces sp. NBC_01393 TaxID=2903851 RepID=A0AAU3IAB4_9ACTN